MNEFEVTVRGIPCIVRVTNWEAYQPAFISGPPDSCYPEEGGYGDMEVLDSKGRHAHWLEKKMTPSDWEALEQEVFDLMEGAQLL